MARKLEENDIITIAVEGFFLILYGTIEREREKELDVVALFSERSLRGCRE
jgi:hypothetical protein